MSKLRQIPLTCSGHTRPVVQLAFSRLTSTGYYLISACKDGKPMLRHGDTGDWIGTFSGHKGAVWGVALNNDATKAASGAADFTAKVWDAISGDEICSFAHTHIVKSTDFSEDSKQLLTGSNEKLLHIFDLTETDAEAKIFSGHTASIRQALFLPECEQFVSASDDRTVRMWDIKNGQDVRKVELPSPPSSLEISQDGSLLLITHGHTVSFWDLKSWVKVKEYHIPTQVNSASLHPDKEFFVCGGEDFKMYKFDYSNGAEIESCKGHFGPVHCVRFSPDGEVYASGSEDGTLRLWQTSIGKTYGLWKCIQGDESVLSDITNNSNQQVKTDAINSVEI